MSNCENTIFICQQLHEKRLALRSNRPVFVWPLLVTNFNIAPHLGTPLRNALKRSRDWSDHQAVTKVWVILDRIEVLHELPLTAQLPCLAARLVHSSRAQETECKLCAAAQSTNVRSSSNSASITTASPLSIARRAHNTSFYTAPTSLPVYFLRHIF